MMNNTNGLRPAFEVVIKSMPIQNSCKRKVCDDADEEIEFAVPSMQTATSSSQAQDTASVKTEQFDPEATKSEERSDESPATSSSIVASAAVADPFVDLSELIVQAMSPDGTLPTLNDTAIIKREDSVEDSVEEIVRAAPPPAAPRRILRPIPRSVPRQQRQPIINPNPILITNAMPGTLVKITVGITHTTDFYILRHLLTRSSMYFRFMLQDPRTMTLRFERDVVPEFYTYERWLLCNEIILMTIPGKNSHWLMWVRLTVLASVIRDRSFQIAIVDSILLRYHHGPPMGDYPTHEAVSFAYAEGQRARGMGQLFMDVWANWCGTRFVVSLAEVKKLPREFAGALYLWLVHHVAETRGPVNPEFNLADQRLTYLPPTTNPVDS